MAFTGPNLEDTVVQISPEQQDFHSSTKKIRLKNLVYVICYHVKDL